MLKEDEESESEEDSESRTPTKSNNRQDGLDAAKAINMQTTSSKGSRNNSRFQNNESDLKDLSIESLKKDSIFEKSSPDKQDSQLHGGLSLPGGEESPEEKALRKQASRAIHEQI